LFASRGSGGSSPLSSTSYLQKLLIRDLRWKGHAISSLWITRRARECARELPGDTSRRKLDPPLIMFALIRAIAIAGTVALAFGLDLSHGYWMPIAALVAPWSR
jgi:hypothetical protein